jgi:hypothetical protein
METYNILTPTFQRKRNLKSKQQSPYQRFKLVPKAPQRHLPLHSRKPLKRLPSLSLSNHSLNLSSGHICMGPLGRPKHPPANVARTPLIRQPPRTPLNLNPLDRSLPLMSTPKSSPVLSMHPSQTRIFPKKKPSNPHVQFRAESPLTGWS